MTNVTLHPTIAGDIALAIIKRTTASEMIHRMTTCEPLTTWDQNKFLFWVGEHQAANAVLASYGIHLATFNLRDAKGEATQ